MRTISSEVAVDHKQFEQAWKHWYVQLGHVCDTQEDWDFYKKLEAFILNKIEQEKFDNK